MTREQQFKQDVRRWWKDHRRDFPWRETTDPYAILVSEIMLQQTQADRVVPKYEAFLGRYPNVTSLARARDGSVLRLWSGLGYNRRALNLKRTAQKVVREYGGIVPDREELLLQLPGVGQYTAKAVLAFAHNKTTAPVDTNIRRIFIRHFGRPAETELQVFADTMVPTGNGREWSSMLMDFGALVCTAKPSRPGNPTCAELGFSHIAEPKALPKQKPFHDSDRFWRGRIVEVLRQQSAPMTPARLRQAAEVLGGGKVAGDRAMKLVAVLIDEGLVRREHRRITLV